MTFFRFFLLIATVLIYGLTVIATVNQGANWPAVAITDLAAMNWRLQFDTDFLIYLFIGATWICWREGQSLRGYLFALLSVVLGGMFSFPYLLAVTYQSKGNVTAILLGARMKNDSMADLN